MRAPTPLAAVLLLCATLAGCSSDDDAAPAAAATPAAALATASPATTVAAAPATPTTPTTPTTVGYSPAVESARFSTTVDNRYFPLPVGRRWVYETKTEDGTERVVVEVTSATKTVAGVECVVVRDTARLDGKVIEDTYDWYAQDADGNVWYFGEDTRSYEEDGPPDPAGSWEAGVDGAQPGIVMEAQPKAADRYRQEYLAGQAEDEAEVLRLGEAAQVRAGSYDDVVVTRDFTRLEPDAEENKYFAPGVGVIKSVTMEDGEVEELVEMTG